MAHTSKSGKVYEDGQSRRVVQSATASGYKSGNSATSNSQSGSSFSSTGKSSKMSESTYKKYDSDFSTWSKTGNHSKNFNSWANQSELDLYKKIKGNTGRTALIDGQYLYMDNDTYDKYGRDYNNWKNNGYKDTDDTSWRNADDVETFKAIRGSRSDYDNGFDDFRYSLNDDILQSVSEKYKSQWGDKYYYDYNDPEDMARQANGQMPKYLESKYDLGDAYSKFLYDNNLPYNMSGTGGFSDMYSEAYNDWKAQEDYNTQYNNFLKEAATQVTGTDDENLGKVVSSLLTSGNYDEVAKNFKKKSADSDDWDDQITNYVSGNKSTNKFTIDDIINDIAQYLNVPESTAAQVVEENPEIIEEVIAAEEEVPTQEEINTYSGLADEKAKVDKKIAQYETRKAQHTNFGNDAESVAEYQALKTQQANLQAKMDALGESQYAMEQSKAENYLNSVLQSNEMSVEPADTKGWSRQTKAEYLALVGEPYPGNVDQSVYNSIKQLGEYATSQELGVLNTVAEQGEEQAREYIDNLKTVLQSRSIEADKEQYKQFADEHEVLSSLASVPMSVAGAVEGAFNIGNNILGNDSATQAMFNGYLTRASGNIRNTVSEEIQQEYTRPLFNGSNITTGDALSMLYQTGLSMAETAARMPLGYAGLALAGGSAASSTMIEQLESGASLKQATIVSGIAGMAEVITEKVSLEALFEAKTAGTLGQLLAEIGKQMLVEGSEEVASEVINHIGETIVLGDLNSVRQSAMELMAQNPDLTLQEAEGIVFGKNVASSFIGGALSGGIFGGVGQGVRAISTNVKHDMVKNIADSGISEELSNDCMQLVDELDQNPDYVATKEGADAVQKISDVLEDSANKTSIAKMESDSKRKAIQTKLSKLAQTVSKANELAKQALAKGDKEGYANKYAPEVREAIDTYNQEKESAKLNAEKENLKTEQAKKETERKVADTVSEVAEKLSAVKQIQYSEEFGNTFAKNVESADNTEGERLSVKESLERKKANGENYTERIGEEEGEYQKESKELLENSSDLVKQLYETGEFTDFDKKGNLFMKGHVPIEYLNDTEKGIGYKKNIESTNPYMSEEELIALGERNKKAQEKAQEVLGAEPLREFSPYSSWELSMFSKDFLEGKYGEDIEPGEVMLIPVHNFKTDKNEYRAAVWAKDDNGEGRWVINEKYIAEQGIIDKTLDAINKAQAERSNTNTTEPNKEDINNAVYDNQEGRNEGSPSVELGQSTGDSEEEASRAEQQADLGRVNHGFSPVQEVNADYDKNVVQKSKTILGKLAENVFFYERTEDTPKEINGFYMEEGNKKYIEYTGNDSDIAYEWHEIAHSSKTIKNTILNAVKEMGDYNAYVESYKAASTSILSDSSNAEEELLCDLFGLYGLYRATGVNCYEAVGMTEQEVDTVFDAITEMLADGVEPDEDFDRKDAIKFSANKLSDEQRESITEKDVRRVLDKAFSIFGIKSFYDNKYNNADEWLAGEGATEAALYIDNDYDIYNELNSAVNSKSFSDGDFTTEDILNSYLNGDLSKTNTKSTRDTSIDLSVGNGYKSGLFYEPSEHETDIELANQKATGPNKNLVYKARKDILFRAHTNPEDVGLSKSELNKKLRDWSGYPVEGLETSRSINNGVAPEYQWSGIQNCSLISKAQVTDEDIKSVVGKVEGTSDNYKNNYIGRTLLALDTHINWSGINFVFKSGRAVEDRPNVRGFYYDKTKTVTVGGSGFSNTVAHEMGHALDNIWANDIFGANGYLTERCRMSLDNLEGDSRAFVNNFKTFISELQKSNDISSAYTNDAQEIFARFVAKFVEWTDNKAGNTFYSENENYKDNFTANQFCEFARLLQEKAKIDSDKALNVKYSSNDLLKQYREADTTEQREGIQGVAQERIRKTERSTADNLVRTIADAFEIPYRQVNSTMADVRNSIHDFVEAYATGKSEECMDIANDIAKEIVRDASVKGYSQEVLNFAGDQETADYLYDLLKNKTFATKYSDGVDVVGKSVREESRHLKWRKNGDEYLDDVWQTARENHQYLPDIDEESLAPALSNFMYEYKHGRIGLQEYVDNSDTMSGDVETDVTAMVMSNLGEWMAKHQTEYSILSGEASTDEQYEFEKQNKERNSLQEAAAKRYDKKLETVQKADNATYDILQKITGAENPNDVIASGLEELQRAGADKEVINQTRGNLLRNGYSVGGRLSDQEMKHLGDVIPFLKKQGKLLIKSPKRIIGDFARYADEKVKDTAEYTKNVMKNFRSEEWMSKNYTMFLQNSLSEENQFKMDASKVVAEVDANDSDSILAQLMGEQIISEENAKNAVTDGKYTLIPLGSGAMVIRNKNGRLYLSADGNSIVSYNDNVVKELIAKQKAIRDIREDGQPNSAERIAEVRKNGAKATETAIGNHLEVDGDTYRIVNAAGETVFEMNNSKSAFSEKANQLKDALLSIYEIMCDKANESLLLNGYGGLKKRSNYMPHFTSADTGINGMVQFMNSEELPVAIAGITKEFTPGKPWNGHLLERLGDETDYHAVNGFNSYLNGVSDVIYMTPVIQRFRQLENMIRTGQSSASGESYGTNQNLAGFASWLHDYTNRLANKKADLDRTLESSLGRKIYTLPSKIAGIVGTAQIGLNINSALTNFAALAEGAGAINPKFTGRALADVISDMTNGTLDDFNKRCQFLVNRQSQTEETATNLGGKMKSKGEKALFGLQQAIDDFSTNVIARAKYYDYISQGLSEKDAMEQTTMFCNDLFAERSKGSKPSLFESKSLSWLTQYQIEPLNTLWHVGDVHDENIREECRKILAKNHGVYEGIDFGKIENQINRAGVARKDISKLFGMILGLSAYGMLKRFITGSDATWNPAGIVYDMVNGAEDDGFNGAVKALAENVTNNAPFGSMIESAANMFTGSDSSSSIPIPMLSTMSNVYKYAKNGDVFSAITSVAPGGSQVRKTVKGIEAVNDGGKYTSDGRLQYPVEQNAGRYIQGALFGTTALKPMDYDYSSDTLTEKETEYYESAVDSGLDQKTVYDYLLNDYNSNATSGDATKKASLLTSDLDTEEQKLMADILGIEWSDKADTKKELESFREETEKKHNKVDKNGKQGLSDKTYEQRMSAIDYYMEMLS